METNLLSKFLYILSLVVMIDKGYWSFVVDWLWHKDNKIKDTKKLMQELSGVNQRLGTGIANGTRKNNDILGLRFCSSRGWGSARKIKDLYKS
jgi:hypothetical protein